ncbi:MAG: TPM domain-containing protein [Muribaculaceae bacterium]|nr:TPM domain-containing protein [Muribaculaceae bacterium]
MKKPISTTMIMAVWNRACLRLSILALLCLTVLTVVAQVPARPNPPRLVNDFAGILGECQWLEDSLEKIAVETSNQICVVTMNDFGNYDKAWMAYSIGEQWGVGKKGHNNGVVILIKPKTADSKGEAFIAPGYGLEGAITDATSTRIVNQEMIPYFKDNDYLGGVWAGAQVVRDLAIGEYNEEDYANQGSEIEDAIAIMIFLLIMVLFVYLAFKNNQNNGGNRNNGDTGTWGGPIIFTSGSDWGRGGGSWGGGGSFGGGWGGFGGGSFGGGGGGGSW